MSMVKCAKNINSMPSTLSDMASAMVRRRPEDGTAMPRDRPPATRIIMVYRMLLKLPYAPDTMPVIPPKYLNSDGIRTDVWGQNVAGDAVSWTPMCFILRILRYLDEIQGRSPCSFGPSSSPDSVSTTLA